MPDRRSWKVGSLPIRKAAELYHVHGWTSAQVGERAGVDYRSVIKAFKRHGIPRRACGQRTKILAQHIQMARRKGWTKARLAEHLGVRDETSIINAQKRLGVAWPERDRG